MISYQKSNKKKRRQKPATFPFYPTTILKLQQSFYVFKSTSTTPIS